MSLHPQDKVLTPEEQAIIHRIQGQDDSWKTVREDELNDFSLMADPFLLPPECKKLQDEKKYAFRWAERKPSRIDELTRSYDPPLKWIIVNRDQCPWIDDRNFDPILGCVPRHDQMLLFKPWSWHARVKAAKQDISNARDASGSVMARDGLKHGGVEQFAAIGDPDRVPSHLKVSDSDDIMFDESSYDQSMGVVEDTSFEDVYEE